MQASTCLCSLTSFQPKHTDFALYGTLQLSEEIQWLNNEAAEQAGNTVGAQSGPVNYPSPCLWGSPFTCLGITQNYLSELHCEPGEHPFSFITWQDLLCPGSTLQVRSPCYINSMRSTLQALKHASSMRWSPDSSTAAPDPNWHCCIGHGAHHA